MKIHYRKPSLIEEMKKAIDTSQEPIDHFELTPEEFNQHFNVFDKVFQRDNGVDYAFRGVLIKVTR